MQSSRKLVITSLFAAFICVLTLFPRFPVLYGYVHLGDGLIIAAAFFIGIYAVPAAAIGSLLAELISGYMLYAPATLIIKGLMALVAFVLIAKKESILRIIFAAVLSEAVMLVGYFTFDFLVYGISVAAFSALYSLIQAATGIGIGLLLCFLIKKWRLREKFI